MLLPKEHGAYGQVSFPLVTALLIAGVVPGNVLFGAGVLAAFLAHEPLLVLLGRRGGRARATHGRRAWLLLLSFGTIALAAGGAAIVMTPADLRWAYLFPIVPAELLVCAIVADREKCVEGELAAAAAFAGVAVPAMLVAGAPTAPALTVAAVFFTVFVCGTLAVRTVILRVRGGGNPQAEWATRLGLWMFVATVAAVALGGTIEVGTGVLVAAAPSALLALAVATVRIPATRLKTLGWSLVGTSTLGAVVLVAML